MGNIDVPQDPEIRNQSYASVLSYVGASRRLAKWGGESGEEASELVVITRWTAVVLALIFLYVVITVWYAVLLANLALAAMLVASFAITVILIPFIPLPMTYLLMALAPFGFRSHRRAQRKAQHTSAVQLATMQAMLRKEQEKN